MKLSPESIASLRLLCLLSGLVSVFALQPAYAQSVRIMPLGDSITQGTGGQCSYRVNLSQNLLNRPDCSVEFVGPRTEDDFGAAACTATLTNHAGFSGRRADQITANILSSYVTNYDPDYFLVHVGTNDIFLEESVESTIDDIDAIIANILTFKPEATILLANVIPWRTDPSPNFTRPPVDNPAINEPVLIDQLSNAIEDYAFNLNNPSVRLIDVRSGFDAATMTIDGVHPNDTGEQLIATRFLQGLDAEGICNMDVPVNPDPDPEPEPDPTPTSNFPVIELTNNQWHQIGLPANPGANNRVRDIFANLPEADYPAIWRVYNWSPNLPSGPAYEQLTLDSTMELGRAYWVIQDTGSDVTISMPTGSTMTPLTTSSACTSDSGCFSVSLTPNEPSIAASSIGPYAWDMVSFPFAEAAPFSQSRITTSASGNCSSGAGCTPDDALSNQVMYTPIFHYNPTTAEFDMISGAAELRPWDGVWVPVMQNAFGNEPMWVVAP